MTRFDVVVEGAGPAGATAAYYLAKQGRSVALVGGVEIRCLSGVIGGGDRVVPGDGAVAQLEVGGAAVDRVGVFHQDANRLHFGREAGADVTETGVEIDLHTARILCG